MNKQAVTTSLQVAETFGKRHDHVMRDIKNLIEQSGSPILARQMFAESAYANRGKQYPMYYMNRDGFTLLAEGSPADVVPIQRTALKQLTEAAATINAAFGGYSPDEVMP